MLTDVNTRRLVVAVSFLFLCCGLAFSQVDTRPVDSITNAWFRAIELGNRRAEMAEQSRIQREQLRLLQQQTEELEKLRQERSRIAASASTSKAPPESQADIDQQLLFVQEIDSALTVLRREYKDFDTFQQSMVRMMDLFTPAKGSQLSAKDYLEGLYLIAKYASFAKQSSPPPSFPFPMK